MTDSPDWTQVKEIFSAALDIDPAERQAFISRKCARNENLRVEVESWLTSYAESSDFIEQPVFSCNKLFENTTFEGRRFGHYSIIREIGHGGMGAVYLARRSDGEFEQEVALKIVRQSIAESHLIDRFRRERQILASLNHPNIAKLLDGGVSEKGEPYLAMEFVDGKRISTYAAEHKLSLDEKLRLFIKVCASVEYAHRNLIVHRDLKPANILVTPAGEPKLLDFGLAKLIDEGFGPDLTETRTDFRALTPAYASPEQLSGKKITTSSDVYSLGIVLYELVTEVRPFQFDGKNLDEIIKTISTAEPPPPSINPQAKLHNPRLRGDLDNIILKALRSDPERRYHSVEQFAEDIRRYLDGMPVIARKDTFYYRASKFFGRHRVGVAACLLVLATVITGISFVLREKSKADRRFNDVRQLANSLIFEVDGEIQKGPTKGRAMLARRALEYLDHLAKESGNDSDLQMELAAGYLRVGDIQGKPYRPNLGDTAGAESSYRKAQVLLTALTSSAPNNREAQRYLSLSYQSLGRIQERNGDWDAALESERQAVMISESIVVADEQDAASLDLLADNYLHYGEALYQDGRGATVDDHHTAIEYFRKALSIHSSLWAANPDNAEYQYATGVDYEYIGIALNRLGDRTGEREYYLSALENHKKELEINEALAASDRSNAAYRRIVADVYGELGLSQLRLGRTQEALDNFRRKLAIFESVMASDPTNIEAMRDLVNALPEVSNALQKLGDRTEAIAQIRKAVTLQQAICDAEPGNTENRNRLKSLLDIETDLQKRSRDSL